MGQRFRFNAAWLAKIRSRQDPVKWGSAYSPGLLATVNEAPSGSRPCLMYCLALQRDLHMWSLPERDACVLAWYCGQYDEVHERPVLWPEPRFGPLSGYPPAEGRPDVTVRGTLEVADALNVLHLHPKVRVPSRQDSSKRVTVGFPYLGGLLWYGKPARCVNWSVAATPDDFDAPFAGQWPRKKPTARQIARAKARAAIQERYYQDANVPTVRVAQSDIPIHLRHNLRLLYQDQQEPCALGEALRDDFIDQVSLWMRDGTPALDSILAFRSRYGHSLRDYTVALHQAIWTRRLRVDLFKPFVVNATMHRESADVVAKFRDWLAPGVAS